MFSVTTKQVDCHIGYSRRFFQSICGKVWQSSWMECVRLWCWNVLQLRARGISWTHGKQHTSLCRLKQEGRNGELDCAMPQQKMTHCIDKEIWWLEQAYGKVPNPSKPCGWLTNIDLPHLQHKFPFPKSCWWNLLSAVCWI